MSFLKCLNLVRVRNLLNSLGVGPSGLHFLKVHKKCNKNVYGMGGQLSIPEKLFSRLFFSPRVKNGPFLHTFTVCTAEKWPFSTCGENKRRLNNFSGMLSCPLIPYTFLLHFLCTFRKSNPQGPTPKGLKYL